MVYFKINGLGYNCGYNENKCPKEKLSCIECIKARLKELGFEFDSTVEIFKLDSIEKQQKMEKIDTILDNKPRQERDWRVG